MSPVELEQAGIALYGERWKSPLAAALGVTYRTVLRWYQGEWPIPDGVAREINQMLGRLRAEQALAEIDRMMAEHGAPVEIALTEGRDEVGRRATELVAEALRARGIAVRIEPIHGDLTDPAKRALAAVTGGERPLKAIR